MYITSKQFFSDAEEETNNMEYTTYTADDFFKTYHYIYGLKSTYANITLNVIQELIMRPSENQPFINGISKQDIINGLYNRLTDEMNEEVYISPKTIGNILTKFRKLSLIKLLKNNKWQITNLGYAFLDPFYSKRLYNIALKLKEDNKPNEIIVSYMEEFPED